MAEWAIYIDIAVLMLYLEMFSLAVVLQVLAGGEDAEAVLTSDTGVASVC